MTRTKNSKLSSVDNVHSGAQLEGRDVAGPSRRGKHVVASVAGAERVLLKLGASVTVVVPLIADGLVLPGPWGAASVHWRIMLARLTGGQCAAACGPWRCACGPPVSAGPLRPRAGGSPSSSGVVFLLVDSDVPGPALPAVCPVTLCTCLPVCQSAAHWQWRRRRPAQCGGSRDHRIWRRRRRQCHVPGPVAPGGPAAVRRAAARAAAFSARLCRSSELWVLRSTLTLKTTDTTLVSVDGNIGHRGALIPLPHASPETIVTEETPSATVTPTQSHGRGKARPRS